VLNKTRPASLSFSTWTAASASVQSMLDLLQAGRITRCRWLVDCTIVRRVPQLVVEICRSFGDDAIRVTRTHAKFATVANAVWQGAIRSTTSLSQNPRLESFELGHVSELCAWLKNVCVLHHPPPWSSANFIVGEQVVCSIWMPIGGSSGHSAWVQSHRLSAGFSWAG